MFFFWGGGGAEADFFIRHKESITFSYDWVYRLATGVVAVAYHNQ